MKYAALLALVFTHTAYANGLEDLRTALAPLQGQGALRGAYEARETRHILDAKPAKGPETVSVLAQVEEDAGSLEIRWDRALLKRAAEEASMVKGAKRKEALNQLIGSTSAPRVAQAVNYAPRLLQYLSTGTLRGERMDAWNGKPARLIEVVVVPQEAENDKVSIKENTHVAQIWLSADNLPLAANISHNVKASFMVFMSYEKTSKEEMAFAVAANRLVVLKRDEAGKEKGPGMDSEFRNQYTFTPKA
jgi:hypothetical protein